MSEREEAVEAVLHTFADPVSWVGRRQMAEYIVELRQRAETAERERDEARRERDAMESMYRHHVNVALDAIAKLNHAQAILNALREPSEVVMIAVQDAVYDQVGAPCHYREATVIVRAAVAAAEQEAQP